MRIDVLSIFPDMFSSVVDASILSRAQKAGIFEFVTHDLRDWTHDKHRTTDDYPYGGGAGLVMKVEPLFEALDAIEPIVSTSKKTIMFTPVGEPFTQKIAAELALEERLILVCGRYEGFDERVYSRADRLISIGDYVLTGGELPALTVTDAVVRLLPGALGDEMSSVDESFSEHLLEYPQYTRPSSYRGLEVPKVLLNGDHAKIAAWRRRESVMRTARLRPDLLEHAILSDEERQLVEDILAGQDLYDGNKDD